MFLLQQIFTRFFYFYCKNHDKASFYFVEKKKTECSLYMINFTLFFFIFFFADCISLSFVVVIVRISTKLWHQTKSSFWKKSNKKIKKKCFFPKLQLVATIEDCGQYPLIRDVRLSECPLIGEFGILKYKLFLFDWTTWSKNYLYIKWPNTIDYSLYSRYFSLRAEKLLQVSRILLYMIFYSLYNLL